MSAAFRAAFNRGCSYAYGQTVNYTYGSDPTVYSYGRIVSITYGTLSQVCLPNPVNQPTQYTENYTYTVAGDVATKSFLMSRGSPDYSGETPLGGAQPVSYTYDAFGRVNGLQYEGYDPFNSRSYPPDSWPPSTVNLAYGFDSMGRPVSMTEASPPGYSPVSWVQGVTYDAANRMTSMQYPQYSSVFDYMTESKTYNVNGQLATMTWTPGVSGQGAPSGTITYGYTVSGHTGNNGQVVQAVDGVSGETISYQYDVLKRLTQASSTPTSGSTPAAWTQGYTYDGFGNLTGKGSTAIPVNSATNQLMNSTGVLSNVSYDANGNLLSVTNAGASGLTMTYDEANRVASATVGSSGTEYYGYDPSNHRIYKRAANGAEEWTLYGARGEKLGTFGWWQQCTDPDDPTDCWWEVYTKTTNIWFGGKLLWSGTGATNTSGPDFTDRLGTNRASGARFYPYGDEITFDFERSG
jgi:YD repeat-containing protein